MIISHRLKFAFFANQKTGSKAAGITLRFSGAFDEHDILINQQFLATRTARVELPGYNLKGLHWTQVNHMTPQRAIDAGFITLQQLREYKCYAFLRDPEERFKATRIAMMRSRYGVATATKRMGGVPPPQHEFFFIEGEQVVEPLDFRCYADELRKMYYVLEAPYRHLDFPDVTEAHLADVPYHFEPRHHMVDIKFFRETFGEIRNT